MNMSPDPYPAVRQFEYPSVSEENIGPLGVSVNAPCDDLLRQHERKAHEEGLQEGYKRARAEFETALARERKAVAECIREFDRERQQYRDRVETEVVQLALGIARKVLQREAQIDPLLLAGAVHVALNRLPKCELRLRVSPAMAESWRAYLAKLPELPCRPEVFGDSSLQGETCVLESSLGTAEFGLERQLHEIESGLLQLLASSPETRA
jgi:flagellar assembly protein FliH